MDDHKPNPLDMARQYIKKHGWIKKTWETYDGKVCLQMAINKGVCQYTRTQGLDRLHTLQSATAQRAYRLAMKAVRLVRPSALPVVSICLPNFNDDRQTTFEDVDHVLELASKMWEAGDE